MRGRVNRQQTMFVAFDLEQHVPDDHPLRPIKQRCDHILATMSRDFNNAYAKCGAKGIPPESLIKCLLLRALFGIPSERRLCEACEYNLLYRWFIDRPIDTPMWTPEAFSMNRERFELHDLVRKFFDRLVSEGITEGLVGDDRFSVDGTLIRSLAGHKSIQPIKQGENDNNTSDNDLNSWGQFKGKKRSNATHRSVVDSEARLASKGGEAHLRHSMHLLTDAHTGVCVGLRVDTADGHAERRNALDMLDHVRARHRLVPNVVTADAGYCAGEFLCALEARGITPHAALPRIKIKGDSAHHRARKRMRRRTQTKQYALSQKLRRMIEPVIGWCKDSGGLDRTRFIGCERIQNDALIVGCAWNLMRMTTHGGRT